ncbi:MAG: HEAT repeat domain-containing protein [Candidatus Aminicenantes bacterium]|nr:MAG: HEAT repeat domain-containing protein [Candidatus Aminicenantes bacterium]
MSKKICVLSILVFLLWGTAFGLIQGGESEKDKKIEELIGNLGTRYWEKAADELVKIGEAAVEPLIKTVNIGSGRPSENAILVLGRIGTPKAMDAVVGALKNQKFNHRVRAYAAMALGDTESEDHVVSLIEALQTDSHWWVRNFAVGSLGKIGSERVIDPLIEAMNDENPYVRRAAVSVLGELKPDNAFLSLIGALGDEDWQIRLQAPEILLEFGDEIEEPLLEALKEDNKWIKFGAANVLGKIKSEKAVIPLIGLLNDQDRAVRDEAAVALARINSDMAVQPLLDLLKHEISYVREEAAWALGEMKANDAVYTLIQTLDDGDMGWMAAVSLGKIGDDLAIGPLKKKTADQDSRVGQAAAWALKRMKVETRNDT